PRRQHFDANRRCSEHFHESADDPLARCLGGGTILGDQTGLHRVDGGGEALGLRKPDVRDRVALAVHGLLAAREPRVIRERPLFLWTPPCPSSAGGASRGRPSRPRHDPRWCAAASTDPPPGAGRRRAAARALSPPPLSRSAGPPAPSRR